MHISFGKLYAYKVITTTSCIVQWGRDLTCCKSKSTRYMHGCNSDRKIHGHLHVYHVLLYKPYFIVGSKIFLWAPKIFSSGAHMAPRKFHEVASLSWGVSVWSFMIIGWLQSQLSSGNHFQITMRYDLDLWPFDLKINRAHPWLMVSKCMKFHDHRLITESVIVRKPFSNNHAPWPWPLTFWPQNQ